MKEKDLKVKALQVEIERLKVRQRELENAMKVPADFEAELQILKAKLDKLEKKFFLLLDILERRWSA